jgi:hypothetical protein
MPHTAGKVRLRQLANGEQRLYIELAERQRREDLLRCFGLIRSDGKDVEEMVLKSGSAESLRSRKLQIEGGYEQDDYEHDFDNENDNDGAKKSENPGDPSSEGEAGGGGGGGGGGGSEGNKDKAGGADLDVNKSKEVKGAKDKKDGARSCDYATWTQERRREGLRFLLEFSKEFRQEEMLKTLLANGIPPEAPRIWSDSLFDEDDREVDEALLFERASREIKICWVSRVKREASTSPSPHAPSLPLLI